MSLGWISLSPKNPQGPSEGWKNLYSAGVFLGLQNSNFWGVRILREVLKNQILELKPCFDFSCQFLLLWLGPVWLYKGDHPLLRRQTVCFCWKRGSFWFSRWIRDGSWRFNKCHWWAVTGCTVPKVPPPSMDLQPRRDGITAPKINIEPENDGIWKMFFLFQWCILRFHVNLPGCNNKNAVFSLSFGGYIDRSYLVHVETLPVT